MFANWPIIPPEFMQAHACMSITSIEEARHLVGASLLNGFLEL